MELEDIRYREYLMVPPIKSLERIYELIDNHIEFKKGRDDSIYNGPHSKAVKDLEKIADSALAEIYKTAILECSICMEYLLNESLNVVLGDLDRHWVDVLKENKYNKTIAGNGMPNHFSNLIKLIFTCSNSEGNYSFKNIPTVSQDGSESDVNKRFSDESKRFSEEFFNAMYKNIDIDEFRVLTGAKSKNNKSKISSKDGAESKSDNLQILKSMHANIITTRNLISHGKGAEVKQDYALQAILFTLNFSVEFIKKMKNYNILIVD